MKETISGIRGIVGADLGIKDVMRFCTNFARLAGKRCVTGMDTRPSSPTITCAAHAGLMYGGTDVYDMGMVPTPVVFREARKIGAGVMITSSHNPLEWNGLKFIIHGRGINESELPIIRNADDAPKHTVAAADTRPHTSSYVKEAAEIIGTSTDGKPHVIVDAGGGAAAHIAPRLYKEIGCKVNVINTKPNSRSPDPTTDSLDALTSASRKADIGFAFDLDGDRLVIAINGTKQTPDVTLGLGIAGALNKGYRNFVLSTDTSLGVERLITDSGGSSTRAKVGEANVVDEMIKRGAQAGGEGSSGGFILSEFNHCRDGILAGGMIANMLPHNNKKLAEVLDTMNRYHIIRTKIQADTAAHAIMMDKASKWLERECSSVQRIDGIKGTIDESTWILVRPSNTEDAIRVSAESDSMQRCRRLVKDISMAMRQE